MSIKDVPSTFTIDSEEDLRFAVTKYFYELGFDTNQFSLEDQFDIRLGHNSVVVKKASKTAVIHGRSDLLLTYNGRNLAIVETKAPTISLTDQDAEQAISYARLLRQVAPYAILTNGSETRVYDVLEASLVPIDDPRHSLWYKSGQTISISEDLKYEAARKIVGINSTTLQVFCNAVSNKNLSELSGNALEGKIHTEQIYVQRADIQDAFSTWLSEDTKPCFALIGDSGHGKTNFMCSQAKTLQEEHFVLFYSANRLFKANLEETIFHDFEWQFIRDRRSLAYIVDRFDAIAKLHGKKLIIFLDGIDEFTGNRSLLKSELIDLVPRLVDRAVKLCISCKGFDWENFIIEVGQYANILADNIFSPKLETSSPSADNIGVWIHKFTDSELTEAFDKYKSYFSLYGDLKGTTRLECYSPLMLRLMSEAYKSSSSAIPTQISNPEMFELYWKRRMANISVDYRNAAEILLARLAETCIEKNTKQVEKLALMKGFPSWHDNYEQALQSIVRVSLVRLLDYGDSQKLAFTFEQIRSYAFTIKANHWNQLEYTEVVRQITEANKTYLGVEAVEFYLTIIDRGESPLLLRVAIENMNLFFNLVSHLKMRSSIAEDISFERQANTYIKRLEQYALAYTQMSELYVKGLRARIPPYTSGNLGFWVSKDLSMYQMRVCTPEKPQTIVIVSNDLAIDLRTKPAQVQEYKELNPVGASHWTSHWAKSDLANHLPQKIAWNDIETAVGKVFRDGLLDESSTAEVLADRIWDILFYVPYTWQTGDKDTGKNYYQLLGYKSYDQVTTQPVRLLKNEVEKMLSVLVHNSMFASLDRLLGEVSVQIQGQHQNLIRLYYFLDQYEQILEKLLPPTIDKAMFHKIWGFAGTRGIREEGMPIIRKFFPQVIKSLGSLAQKNFPGLYEQLFFVKYASSPVIIEISDDMEHMPTLDIALLINETAQNHLIFVDLNPKEKPLRGLRLERKTLTGFTLSHRTGSALLQMEGKIIEGHKFGGQAYLTRT
jgi:hypothetical protein